MSLSWCVFDKKVVCPGGIHLGTGVCNEMQEDDPDFKFSCIWYTQTHKQELRDYLKKVGRDNMTPEKEEEWKETIRKRHKKLMEKLKDEQEKL